jgi:hypothetical protein
MFFPYYRFSSSITILINLLFHESFAFTKDCNIAQTWNQNWYKETTLYGTKANGTTIPVVVFLFLNLP